MSVPHWAGPGARVVPPVCGGHEPKPTVSLDRDATQKIIAHGLVDSMPPFLIAHATGDDWARAAETCAEALGSAHPGSGLGFVYASDRFAADLDGILAVLRDKTGIDHWIGSVGIGVVAGAHGFYDEAALAVMIADIPAEHYRVFAAPGRDDGGLATNDAGWAEANGPVFGIVHADPTNGEAPAMIDDLATQSGGFLVGGLTSARGDHRQVADGVSQGGLSGVLISAEVGVATGLTQGCVPLGPQHRVTDCAENVVMSLDGMLALDVFKDDIGELLARDLRRVAGYVHAAVPVQGSDTGDYLVRNLVAIDPDRGWLAIGAPLAVGDRIMFVRRDPGSARQDLADMLAKLKGRLDGAVRGGVYFSCLARGPNMFDDANEEMAIIQRTLGDVPVVGFFGQGEISNGRLYAYTGVLALFQ